MLTLHTDTFWISPYVFTCFVALKEKGLAFEMSAVSLHDKAQQKPDYKARTLTARVPALVHDDFVVAESSAIAEYLEDAFPPPAHARLLPEDVRHRARARQIMSWIRSDDTLALREERPTTSMFYDELRAKTPLSARGETSAAKLLEIADRAIASGATSLFGAWCIADADLAFILHRLLRNGHTVSPKVRAFAEAQWKRPSVLDFVTHARPSYVPYG